MSKKKKEGYQIPEMGICFICEKYGNTIGKPMYRKLVDLYPIKMYVSVIENHRLRTVPQDLYMCDFHYDDLILEREIDYGPN